MPEFSEVAFSLNPERSRLGPYPYGFHIIKVEEVRPEKNTPLEEVRGQIEKTLKEERARDIAHQRARNFADAAYAQKDIGKAAQAAKPAATTVQAWVSQRETILRLEASHCKHNQAFFPVGKRDQRYHRSPQRLSGRSGDCDPAAPADSPGESERSSGEGVSDGAGPHDRSAKSLRAACRCPDLKSLEAAGKQAKVEVKKSEWFSRQEPDKELSALQGDAQIKVFELQEADLFRRNLCWWETVMR